MHIVLLSAATRGVRVLDLLTKLTDGDKVTVFSFREEPWEPPFLDTMRALASERGCTFHEARNVGSKKWEDFWTREPVDLIVAVSWRYMIPPAVYQRARAGAFVFHDSLLPGYRGFSPTVWAMLNGEPSTGVSLFHMAESVDAGQLVAQLEVPIGPDEYIADVIEKVTGGYLELLEHWLPRLRDGSATGTAQDESRASYTCRLLRDDARIDWGRPTHCIYNLVRGYSRPYSGAFTTHEGKNLTIWRARPCQPPKQYVGRVPGRVVEVRRGEGTVVLTGDGELLLQEVQIRGEGPQNAAEVLFRLGMTLATDREANA